VFVERGKYTPREELRREKRLAVLTKFQYENGFSLEEMEAEFKRQKQENADKAAPLNEQESDEPESEQNTNPALYVLGYLLPDKKGKKYLGV
jgi:hypothetical protein